MLLFFAMHKKTMCSHIQKVATHFRKMLLFFAMHKKTMCSHIQKVATHFRKMLLFFVMHKKQCVATSYRWLHILTSVAFKLKRYILGNGNTLKRSINQDLCLSHLVLMRVKCRAMPQIYITVSMCSHSLIGGGYTLFFVRIDR